MRRRVKGRQIPRFLYHWSPRSRRESIRRVGLVVGRRVTAGKGMGYWRPPYLCFSDSPARAMTLCLNFYRGKVLDLYEVWPRSDYVVFKMWKPRRCSPEWRIPHNIGKRRFKRIASRRL